MATTQEKWQEIANRGLQDNFDPQTRAKFDEAVNRGLITVNQQTTEQEVSRETPQFQSESEIPVAGEEDLPFAPKPQQLDQSFIDTIMGGGEAVLALVTGATGGALGFIGGVGAQLPKEIQSGEFGTPEAANRIERAALEQAQAQTFAPRTEVGQDIVEGLGEVLEPLTAAAPQLAGALPISRATLPAIKGLPKEIFKQSPAKQRIAKLLQEGSKDVDTANFKLIDNITEGAARITKDKTAIAAQKQGFDPAIVAMVKGSSNADKPQFTRMVAITKKALGDAEFGAKNRASDVLGNSLMKRINKVSEANRAAGNRLDDVAQSLKGNTVDSSPAMNSFINDLKKMDIGISDNFKTLNFKNSVIEGGIPGATTSQKILTLTLRKMNEIGRENIPNALKMHKIKKFIDNQVTFGKSPSGGAGAAERTLKNLRRNIDGILDENFPKYDEVNTIFSETIKGLNNLQDAAGRKLNFNSPNANKAIGTKLRSLLSNNQSRIGLMDSVIEMDALSLKHGGKFKDNLIAQALLVDELENVLKTSARTGFKGQIGEAVVDAATGSPLRATVQAGKAAKAAVDAKSTTKALKAIEQLIREIK